MIIWTGKPAYSLPIAWYGSSGSYTTFLRTLQYYDFSIGMYTPNGNELENSVMCLLDTFDYLVRVSAVIVYPRHVVGPLQPFWCRGRATSVLFFWKFSTTIGNE